MEACIFSTASQMEAGMVKSALDEKNIANYLKNVSANSLGLGGWTTAFAGANLAFGNIKVMVKEEDAQEALEIVISLFGNEEETEILSTDPENLDEPQKSSDTEKIIKDDIDTNEGGNKKISRENAERLRRMTDGASNEPPKVAPEYRFEFAGNPTENNKQSSNELPKVDPEYGFDFAGSPTENNKQSSNEPPKVDPEYGFDFAGNPTENNKQSNEISRSIKRFINFIVFVIIILIALLPFHYVIGYGSGIKVLAKEHLSFEFTVVTSETVNKIITRYNSANFMEKIQMQDEPLFKKLMLEGIIFMENDNN